MNLERTTILPTDEKALARKMFVHLVHEEVKVVLVVLGKGDEAETTVQRADRMAGNGDLPRWVCWARKPEHIQEDVALLEGGSDLAQHLDETRVFALSISDSLRDVIPTSEPVPSLTRLLLAFFRGEREEQP